MFLLISILPHAMAFIAPLRKMTKTIMKFCARAKIEVVIQGTPSERLPFYFLSFSGENTLKIMPK